MARPDPNTTFSNYAALMLLGGLCVIPQIGIAGLLAAAGAIYGGACFMGGYTAAPPKRRRR